MPLEKIQETVLGSAKSEADRILRAATKSAHERLEHETQSIQREASQQYDAAARSMEDAAARVVSRARGEYAKQLLERRNEILDAVFAEAKMQTLALPASEYVAELGRRLEQAARDSGGVIRVHPDDRAGVEAMLQRFNSNRSANARVVLDAENPLAERGGVVFVSSAYEVDQTLDTILAELRYELGPQIAAELFPG